MGVSKPSSTTSLGERRRRVSMPRLSAKVYILKSTCMCYLSFLDVLYLTFLARMYPLSCLISGFLFSHACQHCRRCGRIFCDRCSSYRVLLDPSDIVQEPGFPEGVATSSSQRVCRGCHDEVNGNIPSGLAGMRANSMERVFVDQGLLTIPSHLSRGDSSSQLSDLAEYVSSLRLGAAAILSDTL